jgi:hypothetical protein
MTKQEIINELSKLYRLQAEGKKVTKLIQEYEEKLCEAIVDELDTEEVDEAN